MNIYVDKHKRKQISKGLCRDCTKPATNGIFCKEHREKYSEASRQNIQERIKNHVCIRCALELDPNSVVFCTTHMLEEKRRVFKKDKKVSGGMKMIIGKGREDKKKLLKIRKRLGKISRSPDFILDDPIEKKIFDLRILSGSVSLRKVSKELGISHEQVRIVEERLANKFKDYLNKKQVSLG